MRLLSRSLREPELVQHNAFAVHVLEQKRCSQGKELNLIKSSLQKAGTTFSEIKLDSISDVPTTFTATDGPDDSLNRPNSLMDDDSDDKPEVSTSKNDNYSNNNN
ncbi:hypothetical protein EC957_005063 [Mortierella hygrophila]|uniref:Uncharacterized protein n=1 Tax=Mortierella hygrophila TaxID=979708 RepID=A0A9P6F1H7_9FUNG|nr:hypothetical protein EC957_005063 [Mortierella hygrophila]